MSQKVEASYGLSPSQMGMLFHRLNAPRAAKDLLQITCRWKEAIDIVALRRAWQTLTQQHPTLRLAFRWEGLAEPVQDIYREVTVPFSQEDWRPLEPALQTRRLEQYLESDRREGFLADQPPLLRLKLFQLGDADYTVVWTAHHAVVDGRSIILVLKEAFEYYEAYKRGNEPQLQPPPRPYRDYVDWCRQYDPPHAETFWRTLLCGFTAPTPLTVDKPVGTDHSLGANYGEQEVCIPEAATAALRTLASQSQVTMNTLVQAAWAVLLSRYSGEDDVVFGATRACRHSSIDGATDMIGVMVNTLPVRARVNPDSPLASLLNELREQHLQVRNYEHTPLTRIQRWSDLPGGVTPFDTAIVFHNYVYDGTFRYQPGIWPNCAFHIYFNLVFTINVMVYNEPQLRIKIIYDRDRMDDDTVARILGHMRTLLEDMGSYPGKRLGDLVLLTEGERHRVLVEWNEAATDYPRDKCLQQFFEEQVERSPDATAIIDGQRRLTYRELNRQANQLAHHLRYLGVGPDDLVGIYMERSLEMMIAILAIIKAGAAYLPLDADCPQARLSFMLADGRVSIVLTEESMASGLGEFSGHCIQLDSDWEVIAQAEDANPAIVTASHNLAYVIYTSGSTGIPKGVSIPHRAVVRLLFHTNYIQVSPEDKIAQLANASFDAATFEIWGAWLFGGQLIIFSKETALSPRELAAQLRDYGVTTLFMTTALFNRIAMEVPTAFTGIRQVLFGGEAVDPRWVREVLQKGKPQRLLHVYGPTETTTFALWYPVQRVEEDAETIPIGRPVSNTQVYVLDRQLQPVPVGIPGQLCISGDGLARDYANRPELTAEKFIPNPFRRASSCGVRGDDRIYLTGDLVRYLVDGNIEFLGRMDRQIKIRGFRVELGEIETELRRHAAVRECAVILREDVPGDKRLVAYVVPSGHTSVSMSELRRFLQVKLPEYMIPATLVTLDALPLSSTGKVDGRALPTPDRMRVEFPSDFVAPRAPVEETLATIWADVLGVDRVGIGDNFFELGGDSILSIQVVARANQAGLKLTPRQIFQCQTIERLAGEVQTTIVTHNEPELVVGDVPLTPIQQWFFERDLPEPHHFNQWMLLRLRYHLEIPLLEKAVARLLLHHDALRLRFVHTESGWHQSHSRPDGVEALQHTDLSQTPAGDVERVMQAKTAELQSTLNLSEGPLFRFHLFKCGADEPDRLLIIAHHLVIDGVSWRILCEDLETAYEALQRNEEIHLPPKTTSFKSWARGLLEHAQSPQMHGELNYWLAQPREGFGLLPTDALEGEGDNTVESWRNLQVDLSAEETRLLLQQLPTAYGTQINEVLLAALAQSLAKATASDCFLISLEGHGREEILEGADLSRTIGWFTTMFPIRLHMEDAGCPGDTLKSIKEQLRRIPQHGIGYGLLRYLCRDAETTARLRSLPQPELSFNYLGQFDQIFSSSRLFEPTQPRLSLAQCAHGRRDHVLSVNASILGGRLQLEWSYSANVHRQATVERLAADYINALRRTIEHCSSPDAGEYCPSDFPEANLSQQELDALLRELGGTTPSKSDG